MGFQYEGEAKRFLAAMRERLSKFKLELHPDKTRLIQFGRYAAEQCRKRGAGKPETFDFLGFTHCCGQYSDGFKIVRLTVKKRMRATLAAIRETLMRRRHEPIPVVGRWLGRVVKGYFNYYAVPGNMCRLSAFRTERSSSTTLIVGMDIPRMKLRVDKLLTPAYRAARHLT